MKYTYIVWCPSRGETADDGARTIVTYDEQEAAREWARWSDDDSGEYSIAHGKDLRVMVRTSAGVVSEWVVDGYYEPTYEATQLKD